MKYVTTSCRTPCIIVCNLLELQSAQFKKYFVRSSLECIVMSEIILDWMDPSDDATQATQKNKRSNLFLSF